MTTLEDQVAQILSNVTTLLNNGIKGDPAVLAGITNVQATVNAILAQDMPTPLPQAPTVTAISPASGSVSGGTNVTITGTNLTGLTGVQFGLVAGTNLTVTNDTTATVTSPAQPAGVVDVQAIDAAGTSPVVPADQFTYS